jgi:hypothetical protein
MAHFAQLNEDNMVTQVIVIDNKDAETEQAGKDFIAGMGLEGNWVQTSYNANFRGKFAGIGNFYDETTDTFINLHEKSKWLQLASIDYTKDNSEKSILVDGFPRSGNVYLSYVLGFGFDTCSQYTGYKYFHNKESITEGPSKFDVVVVPVRTPVDSIKSAVSYFNYDPTDEQGLFTLATDNLEWMKLIRDNKDKLVIVGFATLTTDPQAIVNKIAKAIKVLPSSFTDAEITDRMEEDGMSLNLPNETTSNNDVDLSNPLIAEVIAEATEIYNVLISNNGSN